MKLNKLLITGMFILFACGPGDMVSKVQAQENTCTSLEEVKKDTTQLYLDTFGAPPVIGLIDEATSKSFDKVYSASKGVEPEKNLDQIVHFSNGKYDLIVFMYKGCAGVASKIMNKDFRAWMGKIES